MSNYEIIRTGLYSDKAYDVLSRAVCAVHYILNSYTNQLRMGHIARDTDGEVIIDRNVNCDQWNSWRLGDVNAKNIGIKIKNLIVMYVSRREEKNSERTFKLTDNYAIGGHCNQYTMNAVSNEIGNNIKFNVKDLYFIFDVLLDHKPQTLARIYGKDYVNEMVGCKADPFKIEQEKLRREEVEKIVNIYKIKTNDRRKQFDQEYKILVDGRDKDIEELDKERDAKIAEIDKMFAQLNEAI